MNATSVFLRNYDRVGVSTFIYDVEGVVKMNLKDIFQPSSKLSKMNTIVCSNKRHWKITSNLWFLQLFQPISNADFVVPVEIDGTVHQVYVLKRPHVDEFLKRMGELYECVLFTASLAKYADPVADLLDKWQVFRARLFRESCVFHRGNYVKDLNKLGRELQQIVIVDNSPASYIFHPDNAVSTTVTTLYLILWCCVYIECENYVHSNDWLKNMFFSCKVPVASWFDDMTDSELLDLIPFFEKLSKMDNVYTVLCNSNHPYNNSVPQLNGPSGMQTGSPTPLPT